MSKTKLFNFKISQSLLLVIVIILGYNYYLKKKKKLCYEMIEDNSEWYRLTWNKSKIKQIILLLKINNTII